MRRTKVNVYLTDDEKIQILKEFDESGMNPKEIIKKWNISLRSLYNFKEQLWPLYLSTKETIGAREKVATINTVKIDNSRKMALLEKKSATVIDKVLSIIEHKLDIEEMRLKGEYETDEKIPMADLTRFFQAAAPYFFKPLTVDDAGVKTISKTHSYITNILNQQFNTNGNNKDTN